MFTVPQPGAAAAGYNRDMKKKPRRSSSSMYLAGGAAGALVGVLILWLVLPLGAKTSDHGHEHTFNTISVDELKAMVDRNLVTVIDVRDAQAYLNAHIPGSLQIPVTLVEGEVQYLPKGKPIVTYCTCPAEESSGQAAMILANAGIKDVYALKGGFDAWRAAGLPTKTGGDQR
jgi:rhodanese-related sulfurtransferase